MVTLFAPLELFLLLFGLLAVPSPLGVPPMPEDPALLRAAPADSLVYLQWFGSAAPSAQSNNATERLAAEPEIRTLVHRLRDAVRDALLYEARGDAVATEALEMAEVAIQRPGCLFVTNLDNAEFRGGLVLSMGEHAEKAGRLMRKIEGMLVQQLPPSAELELPDPGSIEGVKFRALPLPPGGPAVAWAVADGYLVLTVGADTPAKVVRGLRGGSGLGENATFVGLHGKVRVARPSFRTFIDLARIRKEML